MGGGDPTLTAVATVLRADGGTAQFALAGAMKQASMVSTGGGAPGSGAFSATPGKLNSTNIYWSVAAGHFVLQSFVAGNVSVWLFKASP